MFMQVHDELVFELDAKMAEVQAIEIKALMSNALKLSIPLDVDVGVGSNWQEAH
jgi:DNA polymerase-1